MKNFIRNGLICFFSIYFFSCGKSKYIGFKPVSFKGESGIPTELRELLEFSSQESFIGTGEKKRGIEIEFSREKNTGRESQNYAVVIGIDDYHYWPTLENARNDAFAVKKVLESLGFKVYPLYNREATREKIQRLITDTLGKRTKANDRVVIFFAGHGHTLKLNDGVSGDLKIL